MVDCSVAQFSFVITDGMIRSLPLPKFQKRTVILSPWGEDKGEGVSPSGHPHPDPLPPAGEGDYFQIFKWPEYFPSLKFWRSSVIVLTNI